MRIYTALSKFTLLVFLFMSVAMTACKDDEEKQPDPVDNNPIVGTWQVTSLTPETPGTTIPGLAFIQTNAPCLSDLKLTFNPNNTVTAADCDAAVGLIEPFVPVGAGAKWKVVGNNLTLSSATVSREFKITQTATELTVVVNTQTAANQPAVNALLKFKRI